MYGKYGRYVKVGTLCNLPLEITFPSAHHSPNTVNKNAKEFVMGTVKLNSVPEKKMENHQVISKVLNPMQNNFEVRREL